LPEYVGSILVLICLLQIKHMFADFFMQTPRMLSGRGEYLHMGRAQHAGIHAVGSALVFLGFGAPPGFIVVLCLLEWVVHFNIDFCKARYSEQKKLSPAMGAFWRAMGADQAMHHLTYVAMAWAWIKFAAV
jgi:hypothetical protein